MSNSAAKIASRAFSENALKILKARYFMKNENGEFIDREPADLFRRVADYVASAERTRKEQELWGGEFFDAMMARLFLPNSPTLTGAGRGMCLSACFVLPIEDSLETIFETVKNAALVHKEGGGTGFDFSRLRPKGSFVRKTQGIASGPVSFLRVIDAATEAVKQGGTRRGANMGILRVDHPDIEEFIRMKIDGRSVNNFNISVAATDVFMEAVKSDGAYDIFDPYLKKKVGQKKARDVFDHDRRGRLGGRRPRADLHRPHQRQQPDPGRRPHPRHQSLRRAAAPRVRVVQPGLDQPGQLLRPRQARPARLGRSGQGHPRRRAFPGRRHRRQPLSPAPDRPDDQIQPPHRARA